jgi:phage major head subunit gpT-like protein
LAGKSFNNVGADGLALASTAHTSKTGKAGNQSNYFTNAPLTAVSLKQAEEAFNNFVTDIGEKANVFGDTLFVPFELRDEAWELVGSEGKLGTNNNDINSFYGKYNVIVSRWLNPGQWFLIDSSYMKKCLYWLNRKDLETKSQVDFNTDNWMIKSYARWSQGFTDWKWLIANKTTA